MALKDNAARQVAANYPLLFRTRVLYSDMDGFRHLNNGATGRYFEEGRAAINILVFGEQCMIDPQDGLQLLFATTTCDFLQQAYYPGEVEIGSGISRLGGSSYVIAQAAFQKGQCFAMAEAVMVKAIDGRPAQLTAEERAGMDRLMLAV